MNNDVDMSMGDDGELFDKLYQLVFKASPIEATILSNDEFNCTESSVPFPLFSMSCIQFTSKDISQLPSVLRVSLSLQDPTRLEHVHGQAMNNCKIREDTKRKNGNAALQNEYSTGPRGEKFSRTLEPRLDGTWKVMNHGTNPFSALLSTTMKNDVYISKDFASSYETGWKTHSTRHSTEVSQNESSELKYKAPTLSEMSDPHEPLRPLSAYNYFFREERELILEFGITFDKSMLTCQSRYTLKHQQELLNKHWNQDRTKKRRHRKSHGIISFSSLSKLVSQRWKELPDEHKSFYKELAAKDWSRYQMELEIYNQCTSSTTDDVDAL